MLRVLLDFYSLYCKLLYPLYRQVSVDSLKFVINTPDVMPPLTSSEKLLFGDVRGKRILDIGTGCGLIALIGKRLGASYVLGVDINPAAIRDADANLERNFPNTGGVEFRLGDLYGCLTGKFDIIVSNPPYFTNLPVAPADYKYCGGDMLARILSQGRHHLNPSGEIRILHRANFKQHMAALAERYSYRLELIEYVPEKRKMLIRFLLGHTIRTRLRIYTFRGY